MQGGMTQKDGKEEEEEFILGEQLKLAHFLGQINRTICRFGRKEEKVDSVVWWFWCACVVCCDTIPTERVKVDN